MNGILSIWWNNAREKLPPTSRNTHKSNLVLLADSSSIQLGYLWETFKGYEWHNEQDWLLPTITHWAQIPPNPSPRKPILWDLNHIFTFNGDTNIVGTGDDDIS